jgi:hypothetical protein
MGITSVHPAYQANADRWRRCRDAYEGSDAVKRASTAYLLMLSGQDAPEYSAYLARALYYGAVSRTIDGFVGAIVRKPPIIKLPSRMEMFEKDTTTSGIGLVEFIKKLCGENLLIGRAGILVDFDEDSKRAYLIPYQTILDSSNNPPARVALGYMQADVKVQYLSVIEVLLVNVEGGQAGAYYKTDHVVLTQEQTEWDLLIYLAKQENFDLWVSGRVLNFQPSPLSTVPPYRIICPNSGSPQTLARDVIVKVRTWNQK